MEDLVEKYQASANEDVRMDCAERIAVGIGSRIEHFVRNYFFSTNNTEDIVQDILVKIVTKLHSFREKGSFESWCLRIAYLTCVDEIRRRYRNLVTPVDPGELLECPEQESAGSHSAVEQLEPGAVNRLLAKLSLKCRQLLRMYFFDDMIYREIGESLCKSEDAVRMLVQRCLKKARAIFDKERQTYAG